MDQISATRTHLRQVTIGTYRFELEAADWPSEAAARVSLDEIVSGMVDLRAANPERLGQAHLALSRGQVDEVIDFIASCALDRATRDDRLVADYDFALEIRAS